MTERRPTWRPVTITLTCTKGAHPGIPAHALGALAVHRTEHMHWTQARWSITHVPTGLHIATANTERLARRFVREVTPLVDWSSVTRLEGDLTTFWQPFWAAMKRAHDGQYVSEVRIG